MHHELKCDRTYFEDLFAYRKKAEVRKNDRDFQEGDTITFHETTNNASELKLGLTLAFTGRTVTRQVTHVLRGFHAVSPEYVVLSLAILDADR